MDNIDEIDPCAVIISARDFPRHWKIFTQFVRTERLETECPIIMLTGDTFNVEEAAKAKHLRVNFTLAETLDNDAEVKTLQEILSRCKETQAALPPVANIGAAGANANGRAIFNHDGEQCAKNRGFLYQAESLKQ
jgi:hypothetical protein